MEVYVLDDKLRRIELIDLFESCIWTDRFALSGDVELVVEGNQNNRRILKEGAILACSESDRIMQIVDVERTQDDQGRKMIKVKGVSAENFFLDNRIILKPSLPNEIASDLPLTGTPAWIAREMFKLICIDGGISELDKLPYYVSGNTYPKDTIAEPTVTISHVVEPQTLYSALVDICSAYDLGFRIVRNQDWSQLRFNVYTGNDRTTRQTGVPAVVFSSSLDNLSSISEYESSASYKNCAIVLHKETDTRVIVYSEGVNMFVEGFEKRTILVDGSSVKQDLPGSFNSRLADLGRKELAKLGRLAAFDGEVNQYGSYKAGVDYFLGDLVEMQSETGSNTVMRVTEQIYASDAQGDRSYPTLSLNKYITPGSWISWDYTQTWSDATPVWADA